MAAMLAVHPIDWKERWGCQLKKLISVSRPMMAQRSSAFANTQASVVRIIRFMPNVRDEPRLQLARGVRKHNP